VTKDEDLLESSLWGPVWRLLYGMDRDIAALYDEAGISGVRTRFVRPLIVLDGDGPLTIQELAQRVRVTHSAMSQTVSAMRKAGLVEDAPSEDARTRRIKLGRKARKVLPFLKAEWRATESAIAELERELPYPMTRVVEDIQQALSRKAFRDRLHDHLQVDR
jgi:DNA-binding MarR family transcriptional regulator